MARSRRSVPTGTVTFLFSDIEGSTELVGRLGPVAYRQLLEHHQRLLRTAFKTHAGVERGTEGDSFLVVFRDAPAAVAAAVDAQRALASAAWVGVQPHVRMGVHSGEGIAGGDDYVGIDINRAARIAAAAHGGQVLISEATRVLSERSLPFGVGLRDLGVHRLKGLTDPERLAQLTIEGLPRDYPPIRSLAPISGNLPIAATTFVGREMEQRELGDLLENHRLVTLLGAGGSGKTRLSIEVARNAAGRFAEGAWFVPLDAISEPTLVGSAIVAALGLRDASGRAAPEQLHDNLSGRELLLVLDNFEQVIEAATLIAELLASAPAVKFIVTSRTPLRIGPERLYPLAPLPTPGDPTAGPIEAIASVRLFLDRARQVQPSFAIDANNIHAIAEICRRLDGLPLAIELAAARITLLGASGIRERLGKVVALPGAAPRDAPARQQTLYAAIGWSYDLLDAPARTLFARLSVFSGGCRHEQMALVCGSGPDTADEILSDAAALADQSLVTTEVMSDGVRVAMLQTIREFAAARQSEAGDTDDLRRRHALTYLALAEASARSLPGRGQVVVLERLAEESDNFRTAIRWAMDTADREIALRLVGALWRYWQFRGELAEGRANATAALEMAGADVPAEYRMRALEAAGGLLYWSGQPEASVKMYGAQLDLAEQLGDRQAEADARYNLSFRQISPAEAAKNLSMLDEIAETYRSLGDERSVARADYGRAIALGTMGRLSEAEALIQQAIGRFRELGDVYYEGMAAGAMAAMSLMERDYAGVGRWSLVWIKTSQELGDTPTLMRLLFAGMQVAFIVNMPEEATTLLAAYTALSRRFGIVSPTVAQDVPGWTGEDPLKRARDALDEAALDHAMSLGGAMSLDEAVAYLVRVTESMAERT